MPKERFQGPSLIRALGKLGIFPILSMFHRAADPESSGNESGVRRGLTPCERGMRMSSRLASSSASSALVRDLVGTIRNGQNPN